MIVLDVQNRAPSILGAYVQLVTVAVYQDHGFEYSFQSLG